MPIDNDYNDEIGSKENINWQYLKTLVLPPIYEEIDQEYQGQKQIITKKQFLQGGYVAIHCHKHRQPEKYCFCSKTVEEFPNEDFIGCDSCLEWYHYSCLKKSYKINVNENMIKKTASYICPPCISFIAHKKSISEGIILGQDLQKQKFLIQEHSPKFQIYDFIFFSNFIDYKIKNKKIEDLQYDQTIIKEMYSLPFSTSQQNKIIGLSYQVHIQKAIENLQQCLKQQMDLTINEVICFQDLEKVHIDEHKQQKNRILLKTLTAIDSVGWQPTFDVEVGVLKWQERLVENVRIKKMSLRTLEELKIESQNENNRLIKDKHFLDLIYQQYLILCDELKKYFKNNILQLNIQIQKEEKLINEQKSEIDQLEYLNLLNKQRMDRYELKLSFDLFQKIIDQNQNIYIDFSQELTYALKEQQKVKNWTLNFEKCLLLKNSSQSYFQNLLEECLYQMSFSCPQMKECIQIYHKYECWAAKVKGVDIEQDAYEDARISEEDLYYLLQEGQSLPFQSEELKEIQGYLDDLKKQRFQLEEFLCEEDYREEKYQAKKTQIDRSKFKFAAIDDFYSKIELHKEITQGLQKKPDLEEIAKYYDIARKNKFEKKLICQIQQKLDKANEYKQKIQEIILAGKIEEDECELLRKIQKDIQASKLTLKQECEIFNDIKKSNEWLKNIYKLFSKFNQIDMTNFPKIKIQIDTLKKHLSLSDYQQILTINYTVIRQNVKEGMKNRHYDTRIKEIYVQLSLFVWNCEASSILEQTSEEKSPEEIINLYEIGKELQVQYNENLYEKFIKIEELYTAWLNWKKQYNKNFSHENLQQKILIIDNFALLRYHVEEMRQTPLNLNNKKELEELQILELIMQWVESVNSQILRISRSHTLGSTEEKISYVTLRDQQEIMKDLMIPEDCYLRIELNELYIKGQLLKNETIQYNQVTRNILTYFNKESNAIILIKNRQKCLEMNNQKYSDIGITDIKTRMIKSCIFFRNEIQEIDQDLKNLEVFVGELDEFFVSHQISTSTAYDQETMQPLRLMKYRLLKNLLLNKEGLLEKINNYEFLNRVYSYKTGLKRGDIFKWEKIIQKATYYEKNDQIYDYLKFQIDLASNIISKYNEFLQTQEDLEREYDSQQQDYTERRKGLRTNMEIDDMIDQLDRCRIILAKEKEFFNSLEARIQECFGEFNIFYQKYKNEQIKIKKEVMEDIFKKLIHLPVTSHDEEIMVTIWCQYDNLLDNIKKYEDSYIPEVQNPSQEHIEMAIRIINDYKKQPINNQFVEDLIITYEQFQMIFKKIKDLDTQNHVNFQAQINMFNSIGIRFKGGLRYQQARINIWNQQILYLRYAQQSGNIQYDYKTIINILNDGYDILQCFLDEKDNVQVEGMKDSIIYLENLIKEVNKFLEQLNTTNKDPDLIYKELMYLNFIEFYQLLTEYQMDLQTSKSSKIAIEKNAVQNAFDNLSIFKNSQYIKKTLQRKKQYSQLHQSYQPELEPKKKYKKSLKEETKMIEKDSSTQPENSQMETGKKKKKRKQEIEIQQTSPPKKIKTEEGGKIPPIIKMKSPEMQQSSGDLEEYKLKKQEKKVKIDITNKDRKESRRNILDLFNQNDILNKVNDREIYIKKMETEIYFKQKANKQLYMEVMNNFTTLFRKLIKLPFISTKCQDEKFNLDCLEKLMVRINDLHDLEKQMNFTCKIDSQPLSTDHIAAEKEEEELEFNENQRLYNETRLEKLLSHSHMQEIQLEKVDDTLKSTVFPAGSIFFLGDINFRFTNCKNKSFCKIYSGEKYEHIKLFPLISDNPKLVDTKMKQLFEDLQNAQKQEQIILKGWIEIVNKEGPLNDYFQNLQQTKQTLCINEINYKVHLMTQQQADSIGSSFKVKVHNVNLQSQKLVFAIFLSKNSEKSVKLNPTIVEFPFQEALKQSRTASGNFKDDIFEQYNYDQYLVKEDEFQHNNQMEIEDGCDEVLSLINYDDKMEEQQEISRNLEL